jgi:hypothetical protein
VVARSRKINGVYLNNTRRKANRNFRNRKWECLNDEINKFAINSKNKDIRELHRGIDEFNMGYHLISNLVKGD